MKEKMSAALAWGGVWMAGALWGGGALVAQALIEQGLSPWNLALARFGLGLPLLWLWHWRGAPRGLWAGLPARQRLHVVATGALMALNVGCWFAGIARLGAALPTVISICCAPVLVSLIATLRGYERVDGALALGLLSAVLGVGLLVLPSGGLGAWPAGQVAGLAWSFGSALCYALVVLGNARMPAHLPAATASAWSMTVATLCMAAVVAATGPQWPEGAGQWAGVAYTGVVTTSVAYLAFVWGARRLSPTAAVVGTLVEPLVAAVLAAWWLGEAMSARQGWGAALLAVAMAVLVRRPRRAGLPVASR